MPLKIPQTRMCFRQFLEVVHVANDGRIPRIRGRTKHLISWFSRKD